MGGRQFPVYLSASGYGVVKPSVRVPRKMTIRTNITGGSILKTDSPRICLNVEVAALAGRTTRVRGARKNTERAKGDLIRAHSGGVIRKPEIVVRAQIDDIAVAGSDEAALGACKHALALVQALFPEPGEIGSQPFDESWIHAFNYTLAQRRTRAAVSG